MNSLRRAEVELERLEGATGALSALELFGPGVRGDGSADGASEVDQGLAHVGCGGASGNCDHGVKAGATTAHAIGLEGCKGLVRIGQEFWV